jgi:nucleoside-diphosphate-sugar epimerase
LNSRRALVTGAAGFIGSHLSEALLRDGWVVVGVDSFDDYYSQEEKRANLRVPLGSPDFRVVTQDIGSGGAGTLLEPDDVVYHLAGRPGVRSSWGGDFEQYLRNNVLATQRLLEACAKVGVKKLVFASSSSVYGNAETLPTGEDVLPRPVSPYGASKLAAEELCRVYSTGLGVPTVTLRYFTVYGPRQRPDMAFRRFIDALSRDKALTIYGDGRQSRDFTFVDDAVKATMLASTAPSGRTFNVGSGAPHELREAVELAGEIMGKAPKVEQLGEAMGDVRSTCADASRARSELGWRPTVSLKEGLRRQVEWQVGRDPS